MQMVIVIEFSEFESENAETIKQGWIKVISKPLCINELLALVKKYSEINV